MFVCYVAFAGSSPFTVRCEVGSRSLSGITVGREALLTRSTVPGSLIMGRPFPERLPGSGSALGLGLQLGLGGRA